jgi:hypothetical protein
MIVLPLDAALFFCNGPIAAEPALSPLLRHPAKQT